MGCSQSRTPSVMTNNNAFRRADACGNQNARPAAAEKDRQSAYQSFYSALLPDGDGSGPLPNYESLIDSPPIASVADLDEDEQRWSTAREAAIAVVRGVYGLIESPDNDLKTILGSDCTVRGLLWLVYHALREGQSSLAPAVDARALGHAMQVIQGGDVRATNVEGLRRLLIRKNDGLRLLWLCLAGYFSFRILTTRPGYVAGQITTIDYSLMMMEVIAHAHRGTSSLSPPVRPLNAVKAEHRNVPSIPYLRMKEDHKGTVPYLHDYWWGMPPKAFMNVTKFFGIGHEAVAHILAVMPDESDEVTHAKWQERELVRRLVALCESAEAWPTSSPRAGEDPWSAPWRVLPFARNYQVMFGATSRTAITPGYLRKLPLADGKPPATDDGSVHSPSLPKTYWLLSCCWEEDPGEEAEVFKIKVEECGRLRWVSPKRVLNQAVLTESPSTADEDIGTSAAAMVKLLTDAMAGYIPEELRQWCTRPKRPYMVRVDRGLAPFFPAVKEAMSEIGVRSDLEPEVAHLLTRLQGGMAWREAIIGQRVVLFGLESSPELNTEIATVISCSPDTENSIQLRLEGTGRLVDVSQDNVVVFDEDDSSEFVDRQLVEESLEHFMAQAGISVPQAEPTPASRDALARLRLLPIDPASAPIPCAICQNDIAFSNRDHAALRLPCGHKFHTHCVLKWLGAHGDVCPICRANVAGNG